MVVIARINKRTNKYLSAGERASIARMIVEGRKPDYIADMLGRDRSTIYREIKRGTIKQQRTTNTAYKETVWVYDPDYAETSACSRQAGKGTLPKLARDAQLLAKIDRLMLENQWSPQAVLGHLGLTGELTVSICVKTLYNIINAGRMITKPKDLPRKGKQKKHEQAMYTRPKNTNTIGTSIDLRPAEAIDRKTFGHWEGDLVMGGKSSSKHCLITLVERKTRFGIVFKLPNAKQASVLAVMAKLEEALGERVEQVIKTITWDNGTSFARPEELERRARAPDKKRWLVFYAHPYRAWERGSNENFNGFLRRKVPKGCDIKAFSDAEIASVTSWLNSYPRGILGWKSASDAFAEEIASLVA